MIGFASVAVLARLLRPEDFGILAMAMLLIGLLESLSDLGVTLMLIRDPSPSIDDMNTAWTLRIVQSAIVAMLVAFAADPAALYFREPRVAGVVYLCALALIVNSFENIGVVLIRKELDFAKDFRYQVILKLLGVVATISMALALRSYWALALAQPIIAGTNVALSFIMSKYRPRLCLKSYRRFLHFSMNIIAANTANFASNKADVFLVGSIGTSAQMGEYNVASELSAMPARELTQSVGRALFPSLAKLKNEGRALLVGTFLQVIGTVAALCLPIGLGLWAVADDLVRVILGEQWRSAGPLMGYLAIYGTFTSMIDIMIGHILIVGGRERLQALAVWIRCALLVGCAATGTFWGVHGVAIGATLSGAIMFAVAVWILKATLPSTFAELLAIFWRPTLAALFMATLVHYVATSMAISSLARLVACIAIGVISYVAALLLLWLMAGRPQGAEAALVAACRRQRETAQSK